jgi:hypothetical protein
MRQIVHPADREPARTVSPGRLGAGRFVRYITGKIS